MPKIKPTKEKTVISFEKFLTDISAGYLSGKPVYSITEIVEDEKKKLLKELFDKEIKDDNYKNAMHSSPCGCAKPHLGGKWIILDKNNIGKIKDDK